MADPQRIETHFDMKPIPDRNHDWSACREGYEPGDPLGYGETEREAIINLLDLEEQSK